MAGREGRHSTSGGKKAPVLQRNGEESGNSNKIFAEKEHREHREKDLCCFCFAIFCVLLWPIRLFGLRLAALCLLRLFAGNGLRCSGEWGALRGLLRIAGGMSCRGPPLVGLSLAQAVIFWAFSPLCHRRVLSHRRSQTAATGRIQMRGAQGQNWRGMQLLPFTIPHSFT